MRPLIRLYLQEKPDIDAIRLNEAIIIATSTSQARTTLFPGKKQGFEHYHVRDDLYLKLIAEFSVATQPEIERADANKHLLNGSLEAQLQGIGIPQWFKHKLTHKDQGMIKLDTIAYQHYKQSTPKEQRAIAALAELAGLNHYAQVLMRTKGQPTYIAQATLAFDKPNINAYNALARLTSSMLRYGGFLSITDEIHQSYVDETFHHEAHYDAHRESYELATNRKQLLKGMHKNKN